VVLAHTFDNLATTAKRQVNPLNGLRGKTVMNLLVDVIFVAIYFPSKLFHDVVD
jgi:hypothetical protein